MVLLTILPFVVAACIVFVTINVMTPFLYEMWFNNLDDQNTSSLRAVGDNVFFMWQIMGYIVPGLIIMGGFAAAQRKSVRENSF